VFYLFPDAGVIIESAHDLISTVNASATELPDTIPFTNKS
jgi:hypothetical protein